MINSTLINILKTFSSDELERFEDLVASPFYNKNSNVVKLYSHFKTLAPEFKEEDLEKELIWKSIYGNKSFSYGVWKNLVYELHKLAEKFLQIEESEKKEFRNALDLLNQLKKRNINKQFEKKLNLYKKKLNNSGINIDYYFYNLNYESLEQEYLYQKAKLKDNKYGDSKLMNKYLFSYFFCLFFRQNYTGISFKKELKINGDYLYLDDVFEFFRKSEQVKEVYPSMLYNSIKLEMSLDDEKIYIEIKKTLVDNLDKLSKESKHHIGVILMNYCHYQKFHKGRDKYSAERFEIAKLMIENDFYHSEFDEYIDSSFFYSSVTLSLALNEISWCEKFIEEFKDKLDPDKKVIYLNFGLARLNGKLGKYNSALEYISKIKPENTMEKVAVKTMELEYYYNLGHFIEMNSLIKNALQFYKGDKSLSTLQKGISMNFVKILKRIVDIKLNQGIKKYDEHFFNKLREEIENTILDRKIWMLKITEELKNESLSKK